MFLLILVVTSICGSRGETYFESHPVDTLVVLGRNVSLSCTLQYVQCNVRESYDLYWKRDPELEPVFNSFIFNDTAKHRHFKGKERYTVSVKNCTWILHIQDVQAKIDDRYFSCYIMDQQRTYENSLAARLTIVEPINIAVIPPRIDRNVGENASFLCQTNPVSHHVLYYRWYLKQSNGSWRELQSSDQMINFQDNNKNITMFRLNTRENGYHVKCEVFMGSSSIMGETFDGWLFVHENTMETTPDVMTTEVPLQETEVPTQISSKSPPVWIDKPLPRNPLDRYSTPSATQTSSSTLPSKKKDTDTDSDNPSSGSTDLTAISVGGAVGAGFLVLLIGILVYLLVFRGRSKSETIDGRESRTPQDVEGESVYVNGSFINFINSKPSHGN